RMVMTWKGQTIADLSRAFLNTNGADKHTEVEVTPKDLSALSDAMYGSLREMAGDLKTASRRGLVERFDGSIGAGSVTMPFGGKAQKTPAQSMAALLPVLPGEATEQASVMSWALDPDHMSLDPYTGARAAVYQSMAKLVAAGCDYTKAYLTLQEFFEKLRTEPTRWGKPFAALLGAMDAQLELGAAAIGGKDSMSGTFLDMDVPPTLISFAIAPVAAGEVLTPEFKEAGHPVYLFAPDEDTAESQKAAWDAFYALHKAGKVRAAWAVENGLGEAVMKMSFGNKIGFKSALCDDWHSAGMYGFIVAELSEQVENKYAFKLGETTAEEAVDLAGDKVSIDELIAINEGVLEGVYPTKAPAKEATAPAFAYDKGFTAAPAVKCAKPRVLIPVFPGTNCEYDSARAMEKAGAEADIVVIRNLTADDVAKSVETVSRKIAESQMIFIPGGFSGGDEPDGSAKFITAFFRNPEIKEQVTKLLDCRDGLMLGICNGFQALIKLGLVPYGKIIDTDASCPTLTYNIIGRHQSKLVRTRVCTNKSPWLAATKVGEIYTVPISHGEGRFLASDELVKQLAANGQIATQYVDLAGNPTMDTEFNPNGSIAAIEGIVSPDGRVLGKMGHSERIGKNLYRNVVGEYDMQLFASAVKYFKG
ncbi:MAG: phosphoribosylformylglycinamidine synthase subunit PurQ, partial [Clostridia bacterium]|nr:phosphoribosylformylglycinamidine synthase subunit PurQ [Clostridia bacterium]